MRKMKLLLPVDLVPHFLQGHGPDGIDQFPRMTCKEINDPRLRRCACAGRGSESRRARIGVSAAFIALPAAAPSARSEQSEQAAAQQLSSDANDVRGNDDGDYWIEPIRTGAVHGNDAQLDAADVHPSSKIDGHRPPG